MTREQQKELALILYTQGIAQKEIATKIAVSEKTLSTWAEKYNWKEKRAMDFNKKN